MYTVHTRTTSPLFQKSAFSVLRRYSDFVWLYETLCYNNPGVVVPPVPEKNAFGRFEDQFLRQRRLALEKCITKIANHPTLGKDPDLRLFLESDTFALDIKHRKPTPTQDKSGLFSSIGALTGPRFHETDEWFDRQKAYLDSLESQLRGLVRAIETVAKHRQELSVTIGEFAQQVSDLSASDVGRQLSTALGELAEVERKAQEMQSAQSEEDCTTIMATVDEYARLINSVRAAFQSRIRVYYAWKNAESDLLRTKQTHEKNRAQGRIPTERLGFSLNQIADAERRVLEAKHEYDHVCKLVKTEVARFEQERIDDFKDSLHAFLEGMISRQKEEQDPVRGVAMEMTHSNPRKHAYISSKDTAFDRGHWLCSWMPLQVACPTTSHGPACAFFSAHKSSSSRSTGRAVPTAAKKLLWANVVAERDWAKDAH
ncbi:hypothetical protein NMY22_g16080 [Coprinellus aureogranulatus]|nr:hypothetical protein NMY22_g16080 [Coprinellus aureogranulatus]